MVTRRHTWQQAVHAASSYSLGAKRSLLSDEFTRLSMLSWSTAGVKYNVCAYACYKTRNICAQDCAPVLVERRGRSCSETHLSSGFDIFSAHEAKPCF